MHRTAQYNFPAPIISSRPPASPHYTTYNPRATTSPPAPAATTTTTTSSRSTTEFRGSTNPSEDWTKISDLAERRRIQNRIAQRNYRKKLKRRLEDLERRAQSRSLSPNGEDTDGRSTRESSTDQPQNANGAPTSSNEGSTITVTAPGGAPSTSSPPTSTYDYSPSYSTTTTSTTPYPSQYRTAHSSYSTSTSPSSHYASSPSGPLPTYDPAANQFMYSPYADQHHQHHQHPHHHHSSSQSHHTHHSTTPDHVVDPSFLLPLPPLMSSSANTTPASSAASSPAQRSVPGMSLKSTSLYDLDASNSATTTVGPYVLNNGYDSMHDQYHFAPAGVSSSYYNLDHLNPLPPLLNTSTTSMSGSSAGGYLTSDGRRIN